MLTVAILVGAYLLGSIPFSFLVARARGVDVRQVGSGNVGATNVMRSVGPAAGLLAFLLDSGKGALAAWLAQELAGAHVPESANVLPAAAAAIAVIGHVYPVWLGFRGGKGVATGAGAFLPIAPLAAGLAIVTFAVVLAATRYVSAASVAGAVMLAVLAFLTQPNPAVALAALVCTALIVVRHRGNLERLRRGEEPRLGTPR
jgi:glycerol-3-phosphate acyltransferase PlsY